MSLLTILWLHYNSQLETWPPVIKVITQKALLFAPSPPRPQGSSLYSGKGTGTFGLQPYEFRAAFQEDTCREGWTHSPSPLRCHVLLAWLGGDWVFFIYLSFISERESEQTSSSPDLNCNTQIPILQKTPLHGVCGGHSFESPLLGSCRFFSEGRFFCISFTWATALASSPVQAFVHPARKAATQKSAHLYRGKKKQPNSALCLQQSDTLGHGHVKIFLRYPLTAFKYWSLKTIFAVLPLKL